jgi:HEAT repeat protein
MTTREYNGAVAKLLTIGMVENAYEADKWPNYPQDYGVNEADIPELIRLATDKDLYYEATEEEYPEEYQWGIIHAVRALGQLKASEAVEPLMQLLKRDEDDDYMLETLPPTFGLIGQPAIAPLATALRKWYSKEYDFTAAPVVDAL